jgi:hypothetical protein
MCSGSAWLAAPALAQEKAAEIGARLPDLAVVAVGGARGWLGDFAEREALLVAPDAGDDAARAAQLDALGKQLEARGAALLRIDAAGEGAALLRALGVDHEGEVALLDGGRRLRWRGAQSGVEAALAAILAGTRITVAEPDAADGSLGAALPAPTAPLAAPRAPPTWHGAIHAITVRRCEPCHRPGAAGPFPLVDRDDFEGVLDMAGVKLRSRTMPPWFATESSGPFVNDTRLAPDERKQLLLWLQAAAPEGEAVAGAPPVESLAQDASHHDGWHIGTPDLVISSAYDYPVPAGGVIPYVRLGSADVIPESVWVQAIEVRPTQPQVVHHLAVIAEAPGGARGSYVDGLVPGKAPTIYPPGVAKRLEKGSKLGFSIHYTPDGTAVKDRIRVGFVFAKEPPKWRVQGNYLRATKFAIPPYAKDFTVACERRLPFDSQLVRLVPHMHLRGKSIAVDLTFPDGTKRRPLELDRWHPDWQFAYEFVEPITLPRGTVIHVTGVFDNSADNPFNPDPAKKVFEGPQIFNEMSETIFEWLIPADQPLPVEIEDDDGR